MAKKLKPHERKQASEKGWRIQIACAIGFMLMVLLDSQNGPDNNIRWEVYLMMAGGIYGARPETVREFLGNGKK